MERMSHSMYRIVPHALRRLAALRAAVAALAVAVVWIAPQARGEVVASWNLNAVDPTQWTLYDADVGIGTLDVLGLGASASVLQGTTLGGLKGDVAGNALAAIGTLANGTSMRLDFETGGHSDLMLSFATRRSATGPSMNRVEYWSGFGWLTAHEFASNATAWELVEVKFSMAEFTASGFASLRIVVDGATSSSGSVRFDNIMVSGTPAPAPGACALLALAGCIGRRRR